MDRFQREIVIQFRELSRSLVKDVGAGLFGGSRPFSLSESAVQMREPAIMDLMLFLPSPSAGGWERSIWPEESK
jgi:hypothetical protein